MPKAASDEKGAGNLADIGGDCYERSRTASSDDRLGGNE